MPFVGQLILTAIYGTNVHRHWYYNPQEGADTIQLVLDPRRLNPLPVRSEAVQEAIQHHRLEGIHLNLSELSKATG